MRMLYRQGEPMPSKSFCDILAKLTSVHVLAQKTKFCTLRPCGKKNNWFSVSGCIFKFSINPDKCILEDWRNAHSSSMADAP